MRSSVGRSLTVGSLFAGIGGFDLGLERAGHRVKWQVEIDAYCQRVLAKHWPHIQRYGDINTIDWASVEPVDLICGGFPCQPFSIAGRRKGQGDNRYLWPEVVRCLSTARPPWFLGENVPGIITMALDQVYSDLEGLGYTVRSLCIPACAVNAPHKRQRVWIIAYNHSQRREGSSTETVQRVSSVRRVQDVGSLTDLCGRPDIPKPLIRGGRDGVPYRMDRTRGLGNAIVPAIAEIIGNYIGRVEHEVVCGS